MIAALRTRTALTVLALATVLATGAPDGASATTVRASAGGVTAVFSFRGASPAYHDLHLTITRGGRVVHDAPVSSRLCGTLCWPGGGSRSVHVLDLAGDGIERVVLDLYSGGAHCCSIEQVYSPGNGAETVAERNFGDYGDALRRLVPGGPVDFVSADDRFADAFTSFAGSGLPLQILEFGAGAFRDVTARFPGRVARDAATWLGYYRRHLHDGEGLIAAWAADEFRLGRRAAARARLAAEVHRGHLTARYVRALLVFLRRNGYG